VINKGLKMKKKPIELDPNDFDEIILDDDETINDILKEIGEIL
jgi:hypothetical protein